MRRSSDTNHRNDPNCANHTMRAIDLICVIQVICALGVASGLAARAVASGAVYRCAGAAGEVLFTDAACPGGVAAALRPVTTIEPAPLTSDETKTLTRLDREHAAYDRGATRSTATTNEATAHAAQRCEAAQDRLDRARSTLRHGYRAARAQALHERERQYTRQRDRACGEFR